MPLLSHWQSTSLAISPVNKDAEAVCQETTPIQEKLDKLGKQITVLGASAAAIVFAIEVIQFVMNGQLNFMLQHFKNFLGAAPEEEATVLFTVVFETVPLSVGMWGKMLLTAFTVIILNEVVKAVKRLFGRK